MTKKSSVLEKENYIPIFPKSDRFVVPPRGIQYVQLASLRRQISMNWRACVSTNCDQIFVTWYAETHLLDIGDFARHFGGICAVEFGELTTLKMPAGVRISAKRRFVGEIATHSEILALEVGARATSCG